MRCKAIFALLALAALAVPFSTRNVESNARGRSLRVMSYNIHVGVGMDKRLDLKRIADVILREKPDLVGLQEVDRGVERTGRIDEIAELARLTKMDYAFAHNLDYQGGQYGVAILSRYPILATDHRRYMNLREAERRGFLRAEVFADGLRVNFVTTHLDYRDKDNRLHETRQLTAALKAFDAPVIIAGDFNDEPTGESYKLLLEDFKDAWLNAGAGAGFTFPSDKPAKRIDYIFIKGEKIKVRRAWTTNSLASDHLPLAAELELKSR